MTIIDKTQGLALTDSGEIESLVELFDVYLPGQSTPIYFTNGFDLTHSDGGADDGMIEFDGNSYVAIPIQIDGIEKNSAGAANRPTLTVANIATISRSVLATSQETDGTWDDPKINEDTLYEVLRDISLTKNEELIGTKIKYRVTLSSQLGQANPDEFPSIVYWIDRVAQETNITVSFELAHSFDIEGAKLPGRVVVGRYCPWEYQGWNKSGRGGCSWPLNNNLDDKGERLLDKDDNIIATSGTDYKGDWVSTSTYSEGDYVRRQDNDYYGLVYNQFWKALRNVPAGTGEPENNKYYWYRYDSCGKLISSCKLRFQYVGVDANGDDEFDTDRPMAFGGFPGVRTFK